MEQEVGPGEGEYSDFSIFYRKTLDNVTTISTGHNDNDIPDHPRLSTDNIEKFQYYSVDKFNDKFNNSSNQFSTLNINIRVIDCNFDNLVLYLNTLSVTFDFIVLTECHLYDNKIYSQDLHNQQPISGYDRF